MTPKLGAREGMGTHWYGGGVTIRRNTDRLEKWANRNLMKFNMDKHQIWYL